jgi:hypothetical protein
VPPPSLVGPTPMVTQHSPWPGGPPQWSAPVRRNGPVPPPAPTPSYGPSHFPEYTGPYPRPGPPVPFSAVAPPRSAHHSPPPAPFGMPAHHVPSGQPGSLMSGRPPSPPRLQYDYTPGPGLGIGPTIPTRPFAEGPRRSSIDSPINGYPVPAAARPFGPAPPARSMSQVQSLAQIAQVANEHPPLPHQHGHSQGLGHHVHGHSRHTSVEGTPRLGSGLPPRATEYPSPVMMHRAVTPGDRGFEERERPGASASPSLRNLLS